MYFGGLYGSKVIIHSNSAGQRGSDLSLNNNVEVLVKLNLILVSRQFMKLLVISSN
jgi:hypothetical protein